MKCKHDAIIAILPLYEAGIITYEKAVSLTKEEKGE